MIGRKTAFAVLVLNAFALVALLYFATMELQLFAPRVRVSDAPVQVTTSAQLHPTLVSTKLPPTVVPTATPLPTQAPPPMPSIPEGAVKVDSVIDQRDGTKYVYALLLKGNCALGEALFWFGCQERELRLFNTSLYSISYTFSLRDGKTVSVHIAPHGVAEFTIPVGIVNVSTGEACSQWVCR
jgi:hypothetical protein